MSTAFLIPNADKKKDLVNLIRSMRLVANANAYWHLTMERVLLTLASYMKNSEIFQISSEYIADEASSQTKRNFNYIIFLVAGWPSLAELKKFMWGQGLEAKGQCSQNFFLILPFHLSYKKNCFILWFLSKPFALGSPSDGIHPFCESIKSIKRFYEEQTQTRRSIGNGEVVRRKKSKSSQKHL